MCVLLRGDRRGMLCEDSQAIGIARHWVGGGWKDRKREKGEASETSTWIERVLQVGVIHSHSQD